MARKKILFSALGVLALALVLSGLFVVKENEYGCVVRFSRIIHTREEAGLGFKVPFLDRVKTFPRAIMLYDIKPSEVLTSDKQNLTVDCYVLWRIRDPRLFYQTLGSVTGAEERLDALTYNALKNVMGTVAQRDIISEDDSAGRDLIYDTIAENVGSLAGNYGIQVVDIRVKRLDLPEANEQAVYARMISERGQMAEKYLADGEYEASVIRNGVDRQVNILVSNASARAAALVAEGEQEYMKRLAAAFDTPDKQDFYEFTLALDALRASLGAGEKTVILGQDSPLARALMNPEGFQTEGGPASSGAAPQP